MSMQTAMFGGKPSKGTARDGRLKENRPAQPPAKPMSGPAKKAGK